MKLGRIPSASSESTRKSMMGNRPKGTHLELKLRAALASRGIGGYVCNYPVEGTKVDIAFPARKVAIMANGCFWHSCPTCKFPTPRSHRSYWKRKFAMNNERDRRIKTKLARTGWVVEEVWEHEVDDDLVAVVRRIRFHLNAQF